MENVRRMFPGEIVIIDDDVNNSETDINKIKNYLAENRFPILAFEGIPLATELEDHKIGFVICDWKFNGIEEDYNAETVIDFLNQITKDRLIPIFICTTFDKAAIEEYLLDPKGCTKYKKNCASCIFIVKKDEIMDESIFKVVNNWINENPSIKVMKAWEKSIELAKERMFSDLYIESEYWPMILYKSFKEDGSDTNYEMGQFLTRSLLARASGTYVFDSLASIDLKEIELLKILDSERTIYYNETSITPETPIYTGDIFEFEGKNFINIKRQCDLIRGNKNLYMLNINDAGKMSDNPIMLSEDKQVLTIFGKDYNLSNKSPKNINNAINVAFSKTNALHNGKFLEKVYEVIMPCVCHYEVCRIDLRTLDVIGIEQVQQNYKRVARLLEPYIYIITEKFASYISSKGTMRTPEALLTHKFIYNCNDD